MKEDFCQLRRWDVLKSQLNNLNAVEFDRTIQNTPNAIVLDVRTAEEYKQGHYPGARNIDYLADGFLDLLDQMDLHSKYFVYCRSGRRSVRVCTLMVNGGFTKVYNLDGGLNEAEGLLVKEAQK